MEYKYIDNAGFPYLDNMDIPPNTFDYSSWPIGTIIRVLHVPWDRDYSNVVKFDDDAARDAWISEHTSASYKLDTAVNVQPDGRIKLPIPFDVLGRCNYITVSYAYAPIDYEQNPRVHSIGYFIDSVQQLAPSTTEARVSVDYWFTYINELDVSYMVLERGHAPLAATSADWYLEDPIDRNDLLLAPDVSYGDDRGRIHQAAEWIANDGNIYAVFACTGNIGGFWGSGDTQQAPGIASANWFGLAGGLDYFAVAYQDLNDFIIQCNQNRPQFLPTVQAMFLVPAKLLDIGGAIRWDSFTVSIYPINTSRKHFSILDLNKDQFHYPAEYADLAKLYTAPYAHLEITDESGNVSRVDIENTSGSLSISAALNLIYPFAGLDVVMLGNAEAGSVLSSFGYGDTRTFEHGGDWYSTIKHYGIPSFLVSQSQNDRALFNRYFQNKQRNNDLNNAYDNAVAQYNTNYANTEDGANAALQNSVSARNHNQFTLDKTIDYKYDMFRLAAETQNASRAMNAAVTGAGQYLASATNAIAMGNTLASGVNGAVLGGASGGPAGAIASLSNTAFSAMQLATSLSNNQSYTVDVMNQQNAYFSDLYGDLDTPLGYDAGEGYQAARDRFENYGGGPSYDSIVGRTTSTGTAFDAEITRAAKGHTEALANTDYANTLGGASSILDATTGLAVNSTVYYGTAIRSRDTASGVANRNKANALASIDNGNRAQGVEAPAIYGSTTNAEAVASRPMGYFVNIATQSKAGIKFAGDYFLRFGYALGQNWQVDKLQIMKYFTYWQTGEIWIGTRGQAIEDAAEAVKEMFKRGVTVWSDPSKIGNVSIYDNVNGG